MLTFRYGMEMAEGVIHQTEGLFTFGLALALLLGECRLIDALRARILTRRKPAELTP